MNFFNEIIYLWVYNIYLVILIVGSQGHAAMGSFLCISRSGGRRHRKQFKRRRANDDRTEEPTDGPDCLAVRLGEQYDERVAREWCIRVVGEYVVLRILHCVFMPLYS